ncbi:MAG: hypothetical protein ACRC28_02815 [Clostridium sp.]|uniref:hypothetical protein n=1 Tax=Clostridium sp. TaxID=1506 RepID=UPI003F34F7DD
MSMQDIICPHCGKSTGKRAINDNLVTGSNHVVCSKCHKSFTWQSNHGKVKTSK